MRLYILILAFLLPTVVSAYDYTMLEPLPFISGTNISFPALMEGFFKLCMVLGAVLAVLMITLGGIQYMTSDVLEQKGAGRERIKNAVFGLLLLLAIWVILNTINPALLNFQLNLGGVGSTGTQPGLQTTPVSGNSGAPQTQAPPRSSPITNADGTPVTRPDGSAVNAPSTLGPSGVYLKDPDGTIVQFYSSSQASECQTAIGNSGATCVPWTR